jgi:peptidoglycan/xylan/chitin deacetylase (PgdA/CDA1 family)
MYLDISLRKITFIMVLIAILSFAVFGTNAEKVRYFGSTPFFYTVTVAGGYALNSFFAQIEKSTRYAEALFTRDATRPVTRGIPVLTYHRIVKDPNDTNNVPLSTFRDQMTTLKNAGWQAISLQDFEAYMRGEKELSDRSFLITFDDGAKESFYPADPILQAYGYHATIYVIVAASETPESVYYLSPQELTWILKTGRWTIGSHSYDGHRPYPADAQGDEGVFFADRLWLPMENRLETPEEFNERVRDDLLRAKSALEKTYGVPINTFAFPLGNETGIAGADNFHDGASLTEKHARAIYPFGFLQTNNQQFSFNFPVATSSADSVAAATQNMLAADFIVRRIHVDHDWDGKRLLSILENGRGKSLPYQDDFSKDLGWITAWGITDIGRNNFMLTATPELTSASTFLDGSELWDNYSFDLTANWQSGYLFVLGDVINSKTYDACVFSPGGVRIQSTVNGETRELENIRDERIQYSDIARAGMRVRGSTIECTWNYGSVVAAYERTHSGGVGIQIWNERPGMAQLQISSVIARPFASTTPAQ